MYWAPPFLNSRSWQIGMQNSAERVFTTSIYLKANGQKNMFLMKETNTVEKSLQKLAHNPQEASCAVCYLFDSLTTLHLCLPDATGCKAGWNSCRNSCVQKLASPTIILRGPLHVCLQRAAGTPSVCCPPQHTDSLAG